MTSSAVEIIENITGWAVRVTENGMSHEQEFLLEAHARSWAAGQRNRLNIMSLDVPPHIEHVASGIPA